MRLSKLKQTKKTVMTRRFAFPPDGKPDDRFLVDINYLSPALFEEKQEALKVKVVGGRRNHQEEPGEAEVRAVIVKEVLVRAVQRIEGLSVGKLRRLIEMTPEAVAEFGGLDAAVAVDPTVEEAQMRDAARDNILFLLSESNEFFNWVVNVCTDLGNFQDERWAEQVENLRHGQAMSSARP